MRKQNLNQNIKNIEIFDSTSNRYSNTHRKSTIIPSNPNEYLNHIFSNKYVLSTLFKSFLIFCLQCKILILGFLKYEFDKVIKERKRE